MSNGLFSLIKSLINSIFTRKTATDNSVSTPVQSVAIKEPVVEKIAVDRWITSDGKYPERAKSPELTPSVIKNAKALLEKVAIALKALGVNKFEISSGFRPSIINASISNAATKSAHMTGEAVDIIDDKGQALCKLFTKAKLEEFGLYREDSDYTRGQWTNWCHLQTRPTKSGNRIFKP